MAPTVDTIKIVIVQRGYFGNLAYKFNPVNYSYLHLNADLPD